MSRALHEGFERDFLSLLAPLGFTPGARPPSLRPGYVFVRAERVVPAEPTLSVELWCMGGTGDQLRMRVERDGREFAMKAPWKDPAWPNAKDLGFAASDFRPGESVEQLRIAIQFLAGAFAAAATQLGDSAPVLVKAADSPSWKAAAARSEELFRTRFMRSDLEERPSEGKFVFVGAALAVIEADGERLTFKFDTTLIDRSKPPMVSGWWKTPAGTKQASTLTVGEVTLNFDQSGALLKT
ncbi:MAG: hypothetical protein ACJ790_16535 [Myxococcaceae bacterium]